MVRSGYLSCLVFGAALGVAALPACKTRFAGYELLDAGAEPRVELRLEEGTGAPLRFTWSRESTIQVSERRASSRVTLEYELSNQQSKGLHKVSLQLKSMKSDAASDPAQDKALEEWLPQARFTLELDDRYSLTHVWDPGLSPKRSSDFHAGFVRVLPSLPGKPIGIGARWTTVQNVFDMLDGHEMRVEETFELVALEGARAKVHLTFDNVPRDLESVFVPFDNVGLVKVKRFQSSGVGDMEFDVTQPMAVNADVHMKSTTEGVVTSDPDKPSVTIEQDDHWTTSTTAK